MPRKARNVSVREFRAFVCTRTMGVSVPSLHRESTDSLIIVHCVQLQNLLMSRNLVCNTNVCITCNKQSAEEVVRESLPCYTVPLIKKYIFSHF